MRWTLAVATAAALVAAAGACGSIISVPDQGIIVTGCQMPSQCIASDCTCTRALTNCTTPCMDTTSGDPSTCFCMSVPRPTPQDMAARVDTFCLETSMACVGRGPLCAGTGALCQAVGTACNGSGDPPQLVPTMGMPSLEPHCQYSDDVCCPGTSGPTDGGAPTD